MFEKKLLVVLAICLIANFYIKAYKTKMANKGKKTAEIARSKNKNPKATGR